MAGETQTEEVAPGVEMEITKFSDAENRIFNEDYPSVTATYTPSSCKNNKHVIADWFEETMEVYRLIGQACKNDIKPSAGVFQGMRAMNGFGFQMIRPDHMVPTAQGRTFDLAAAAGYTPYTTWYGLYHNDVILGAYNATPLYLRKELGIGWMGVIEHNPDPLIDEIQLELNGKPLPVFYMSIQMGRTKRPGTVAAFVNNTDSLHRGPPGSDMRLFRFPKVEYIKPAQQYRSCCKINGATVVGSYGEICMAPIGLSFATAEFMRNTAPTQPSTTAP